MALNQARQLEVCLAAELAAQAPEDHWLVRPVWGRSAAGLVGGEPKLGKSWWALEMAISVASGAPFLGRFAVEHTGPVLVYLAEDELPMVRQRIDSICRHRNISVEGLALFVITEPVLRLDLERDQLRLADTVQRISPCFVILDPLIRLHRLDENDSRQISGLLSFFRELQRRFECAVMITHHTSKKRRARPGQCLRGSSDLHAFGASNAYLSARDDDRVVLQLEHRAARSLRPMLLRLVSDDEQTTHLEVVDSDEPLEASAALADRVLSCLAEAPAPLTRTALREALRVNNQHLGDVLRALESRGLVARERSGWRRCEPTVAKGDNGLFY